MFGIRTFKLKILSSQSNAKKDTSLFLKQRESISDKVTLKKKPCMFDIRTFKFKNFKLKK